MTTTNTKVEPVDGWLALPVGNIGVKNPAKGTLLLVLKDVDVVPTTERGDTVEKDGVTLWDVGTFAWVKTLNNDIDFIVYS